MRGVIMTVTENVSQRVMLSYGVGKFLAEFFGQAFLVIGFFYYETVVQLNLGLTALAFILYSLWNAVNDPLIGYFTEKRQTRFTKKYGRRFPWILGGSLLYTVSFILIFAVPASLTDQNVIFLWLLFSICAFDFLFSLWDVSYQSLFPDKFRTEQLRNRTAGYGAGIGVFGIAFGFILAESLTNSDTYSSYISAAFIFAFIGIIAVILMVSGVKETPDMIERYLHDRQTKEDDSFFKELTNALRTRNFFAWIVLYLFYQSAVVSLVSSIEYVGDYILPPETSTLLIFVGYLLGALLTIPIWLKFAKRIQSNQRMLIITACVMVIALLPMTFASSLLEFSSLAFIMGIGFGGYWMLMNPALADVIDEIVVKTGKRNDGIFMGFRAFFGRLAIAIQALIFLFVHELTGFIPKVEQTESALFGIHLHTATIPAFILICGIIVFWFLNTLTSEKVASNKTKLKELEL
jgi:GPH family glycoside/pentoside/hexuronide:cation symporter